MECPFPLDPNLRERLLTFIPLVRKHVLDPEVAGQVATMLLVLDQTESMKLARCPDYLHRKVKEVLKLMDASSHLQEIAGASDVKVKVKTVGATVAAEFVTPACTRVSELKHKIAAQNNLYPASWQHLVYQTQVLQDTMTLFESGIAEQAELQLLISKPPPLTREDLLANSPENQRSMLAERLRPEVAKHDPHLCLKITEMLLECNFESLLEILGNDRMLRVKIAEAKSVISVLEAMPIRFGAEATAGLRGPSFFRGGYGQA